MTTGKSTYLANLVLDFNLGSASYTPPAVVYIALYLSPLNQDGSGGTEVSSSGGSGYVRQAVNNDLTQWRPAANGSKTNGGTILFPTAGIAWGLVDAIAIYDSLIGGNVLYFGSLPSTINVGVGDAVEIDPGALNIKEA